MLRSENRFDQRLPSRLKRTVASRHSIHASGPASVQSMRERLSFCVNDSPSMISGDKGFFFEGCHHDLKTFLEFAFRNVDRRHEADRVLMTGPTGEEAGLSKRRQ